ncbi:17-beta-hydroxysteroid dehydrogenase type 6-like [Octodon degus]|uniref:17-beta-hydroxysteroid dehydrogenase type 6-like n=1 Tax=Octodon degus TaxID=10160 RepID=A0A6P3FWW2_OCTDE|nr:17-beta-hydroxysteroid dehydrogenase type 6-like [Octodon degus]
MWLYLAALVGLYHLVVWYLERQVVSNLQDKYVFITGCGSGFGNLLARQLDMRGLRVLAALVNNAGIYPGTGLSEWQKAEDFMNVFKVNLFGLTEVTLSMLPLVRRARGRIVNVSSIAGRIALGPASYTCSKFGVEAFSDVLRRELKSFGVKVSIIEPGGFKTGMTDMQRMLEKMEKIWDDTPIHIKEVYGQQFFLALAGTTGMGYLAQLQSLLGMAQLGKARQSIAMHAGDRTPNPSFILSRRVHLLSYLGGLCNSDF